MLLLRLLRALRAHAAAVLHLQATAGSGPGAQVRVRAAAAPLRGRGERHQLLGGAPQLLRLVAAAALREAAAGGPAAAAGVKGDLLALQQQVLAAAAAAHVLRQGRAVPLPQDVDRREGLLNREDLARRASIEAKSTRRRRFGPRNARHRPKSSLTGLHQLFPWTAVLPGNTTRPLRRARPLRHLVTQLLSPFRGATAHVRSLNLTLLASLALY